MKAILIIIILQMFLLKIAVTQNTSVTLQNAIDLAIKKYPAMEAARFEIEKQKAAKKTSFDFGTTSIYTGKEEVGNGLPGITTNIGISQSDIDVFGIAAKSNLAKAEIKKAEIKLNLTQAELEREVSILYYKAVIAKRQWLLFNAIDTLYAGFEKAARLKYNLQQTSQIEFLSASAKNKQLKVNIKKAESDYIAALQLLNRYLLIDKSFNIAENNIDNSVFDVSKINDSLSTTALLSLYSAQTDIARNRWKTQKAAFLPKLNVEYANQKVDGISGFYAWQVGVSVPLLFFAQSGKAKAAHIDYNIAEKQFEQKKLEISARYKQLLSRYLILKDVLDYYKKEALPLSKEQITAASLAYKLGNIDYVQFIQNTETAINTNIEYLNRQAEFLELSAWLKYLRN